MVRTVLLLTLVLASFGCAERHAERYPDGTTRFEGSSTQVEGQRVSTGDWSFYHSSGELQAEGEFEQGGLPGADDLRDDHTVVPAEGRVEWWTFYDAEGLIAVEGNYAEGQRDDLWVTWYENGHQCCSGKFVEGVEHGYSAHWDPEGRKRDTRYYVEGVLHGPRKVMNEDGDVIWSGEYEDGELISSDPPGVGEPEIHGLLPCIERAEIGMTTPLDSFEPDLTELLGQ